MSNPVRSSSWDPASTESWAQALGLVHVPMFSRVRPDKPEGNHAVLLDGTRASFAISSSDDSELALAHDPLSWSWSANMRHTVIVGPKRLVIRRWDTPNSVINRSLPSSPAVALGLLDEMERSRNSRLPDIISRMLKAFRLIRANIASSEADKTDAIRVFNAFLIGSEAARFRRISEEEWRRSRTVGEALAQINDLDSNNVSNATKRISLGDLLDVFIEPDQYTGYQLEPDLLVRHAAGLLYQEAHFELERTPQLSLPGLASDEGAAGHAKRDARFTPPSLARTIVQKSLDAYGPLEQNTHIRILDPACGSGVFLQETLRELASRGFHGRIVLYGFDTSPISCIISRFCLQHTIKDLDQAVISVDLHIEERDALKQPWDRYDIILMNPPFMSLQRMTTDEKVDVSEVLGALATGNIDKAMAFVWRASQSLTDNGVLGGILPSPLLDSNSGAKWREALLSEMSLYLVGRFNGFGYFPGAMVEPSFVVLKHTVSSPVEHTLVNIVTAQEGLEDRALRLLRQGEDRPSDDGVDIHSTNRDAFTKESWRPKSKRQLELFERLTTAKLPRVRDLFEVSQGIKTGNNEAFILMREEVDSLSKKEQVFFRPLAGTKTIDNCQIFQRQFVFFPYDHNGPTIHSEDDLKHNLPHYYARYLLPERERLIARPDKPPSGYWWCLNRERPWKWAETPKLVTKFFGTFGSFAYDNKGAYVVGQGYAWFWRSQISSIDHLDVQSSEDQIDTDDNEFEIIKKTGFYDGALPWAYIALLNSPVFLYHLRDYCPRVQGGQFNLSTRFINHAFLPDLSDENQMSSQTIQRLEKLGRAMTAGKLVEADALSNAAASAYGIPLADWGIDE